MSIVLTDLGASVELRDYASIIRKRWITIVAVTLSVLAISAVVTLATAPTYTARTSLFFAVGGSGSVADLAQGSTYTQRQVESYAEVATAPYVLEQVIEDLDLNTGVGALAQQIRVTVPINTVIIEIAVDDAEPQQAADIANAVGAGLGAAVTELSPDGDEGESVRATTISAAAAPESPSSPNTPRNLALGLVLGLLGGIGLALLLEVLNTKVRTESDISRVTDASVVATIAYDDDASAHPLTVQVDPRSPRAEAYRRLRTNLQFLDLADRSHSIVVTSSMPQEGKTTTSINLAITLAEAGARVLLVDADLRRPQIAKYMQIEGSVGLTTLLIGRATLADVVQPWGNTNLHVLASGKIPPNPSELLGSHTMEQFMQAATEQYDVVLFDSPPLLPVTDGAILAGNAGGALLVVGSDVVHQAQLADSLETLESVDGRVLGLVLNKVRRKHANGYTSYHYHSTYAAHPEEGAPQARRGKGKRAARRPSERKPEHAVEPTGDPEPIRARRTSEEPSATPPRRASAGRQRT
ncbi:polysaccharide biosynthesis tyrosine autokinase [Ruania halotolerans]|uniref:polysaccharide biosynthesis tyrosine autokinase n=1 Tax=Ruania halotolerans TaxID=2897773 RepID=UPI001E28C551|nr:polysaccharide biosynthesis tyrosine autokinase [Ruania halotolerans]UFU07259.1 polysaccharide biosynthesis tyrosine autokinase [Ruania halotolerans]